MVTSEWDTQIARSVRAGKPGRVGKNFQLNSYVFTTFCGCHPAEPVSLTAVAMHQVLTQILLYLMHGVRYYMPQRQKICGALFAIEDVQVPKKWHNAPPLLLWVARGWLTLAIPFLPTSTDFDVTCTHLLTAHLIRPPHPQNGRSSRAST